MIGTEQYREKYIREKIDQWKSEITTLTQIAQIEPQAAYSCFVAGYKSKFTYYMRTVPEIGNLFREIDNMIDSHLIPAITGERQVSETERKLLSLSPANTEAFAYPSAPTYQRKNTQIQDASLRIYNLASSLNKYSTLSIRN